MGETTLLPLGGFTELEGTELPGRGLGEVHEDHVVGIGEADLPLQLSPEPASKPDLHREKPTPGKLFP